MQLHPLLSVLFWVFLKVIEFIYEGWVSVSFEVPTPFNSSLYSFGSEEFLKLNSFYIYIFWIKYCRENSKRNISLASYFCTYIIFLFLYISRYERKNSISYFFFFFTVRTPNFSRTFLQLFRKMRVWKNRKNNFGINNNREEGTHKTVYVFAFFPWAPVCLSIERKGQ